MNDSGFQTSSPFCHGVMLSKILTPVPVLLKFTDGGVDQRNNLESVKCATICLFKELNFDMIVLARCSPGNSWINPAERIMNLLNVSLQNCALSREECDEETEKLLKRCNGMNDLRKLGSKKPEVREKWNQSIQPVQSLLTKRFERLRLKDEPVRCLDSVTDMEIEIFQQHLLELFPGIYMKKLQKVHLRMNVEYNSWLERHARQRHYSFQLKKCSDPACCLPSRLPELTWLPDPLLKPMDPIIISPMKI